MTQQDNQHPEWIIMTTDEAVAMLQGWIENLDDPHEIARLLREVTGTSRTMVTDDGRIGVVPGG